MKYGIIIILFSWFGLKAQTLDNLTSSFHFTFNNSVGGTTSNEQTSMIYGLQYSHKAISFGLQYTLLRLQFHEFTEGFYSKAYKSNINTQAFSFELGYNLVQRERFKGFINGVFTYYNGFNRTLNYYDNNGEFQSTFELARNHKFGMGINNQFHFFVHPSVALYSVIQLNFIPYKNHITQNNSISYVQYGLGIQVNPSKIIKSCIKG